MPTKMVEEVRQKIISIKAMRTLAKRVKINFFRIVEIN